METEENTLDTLKEGDEIEWENCNGVVCEGTIIDIIDEWEVYVEFWNGNFSDKTEVSITDITKINGVEV